MARMHARFAPRVALVALVALVASLVALVAAGCGGNGDPSAGSTSATTEVPVTDTTFAFTVPGGASGSFEEQEVTLGTPPYELTGTVRLPEGATSDEPVPAALIVGDFGPYDEDGTVLGRKPLRDLGEGLAARGVATLTYPKRTLAYQDQLANDATLGIGAETLDDAVAGLNLLRSTPGVDPDRVFLVGHGFGGGVSPRIGESAGGGVAGYVALATPTRPYDEVLVAEARYSAELDGEISEDDQGRITLAEGQAALINDPALTPDVSPADALGVPGAWWLDMRGYDVATALANTSATVPILVVLGGRDYRANHLDREGWAAVGAAYPAVTVEVYDDLDHLLVAGEGPSSPDDYASADRVDARVLESVVSFIESPPG
jgi:dienelactone hydrolase